METDEIVGTGVPLIDILQLLHWVYNTDPEEIEIPDDYAVERGTRWIEHDFEGQLTYLGHQLKTRGRRNPVALLSTNLCYYLPEEKTNLAFFIVELFELELLYRQNHVIPIVTRTASLLEQVLKEELDQDVKLYHLLCNANDKDKLTDEQLRLGQFIRVCRNDAAHNFAYSTEHDFRVHDHAAISATTLLRTICYDWFEFYVPGDVILTEDLCLRIIDGEFKFEWDSNNQTYQKHSCRERYLHPRMRGD